MTALLSMTDILPKIAVKVHEYRSTTTYPPLALFLYPETPPGFIFCARLYIM